MQPKVSVIVPVYNVGQYIERCVNSLVEQTLKEIEIIFVNDGSTDNSVHILNKYLEKDIRIQIVNQKNSGVSMARNKGIQEAKGQYIAFVDADDWIEKEMLELLYHTMIKENSDVVMCGYVREFQDRSKEKIFSLAEKVCYEGQTLNELHRRLVGPIGEEMGNPEALDSFGTVWAKLYNREMIINNYIQFVDLKEIGSNEDTLFNIHLIHHCSKVVFINQPLYHYWKGNVSSITTKYNPNLQNQFTSLFQLMRKFIKENQLSNDYHKALDNRICMAALGLGLNECNQNLSFKSLKKVREFLHSTQLKQAYERFELKYFPLHWKIFYFFSKKRWVVPMYGMLKSINYLRMKL